MKKTFLAVLACLVVSPVLAATDAEELGRCIYNNTSPADRDTLVQFMYVSLGSTNAARKVQSIPQTKINQVNSKTQALSYTVERLVADRIAESTSGWLSSLGGSSENASKVRNAIEFGSALMDAFKK